MFPKRCFIATVSAATDKSPLISKPSPIPHLWLLLGPRSPLSPTVSQTGPEDPGKVAWPAILVCAWALVSDTLQSASPAYETLGGQLTDPGTWPACPRESACSQNLMEDEEA